VLWVDDELELDDELDVVVFFNAPRRSLRL
jgi:hypothetical protein